MKNLVMIAPGKNALYHTDCPKWNSKKWEQNHLDHGFDMCILNYDDDCRYDDINTKSARFVVNKRHMKWRMVSEFFKNNPGVIDEYDHFMMMDDDIKTTPIEIEKFFHVFADEGFDLAQPGLSKPTHFTFQPTLKISGAKYHLTNMVEIMMPAFSQRILKETLVDIESLKFGLGWGLEGVWVTRFHDKNGITKFGGKIGVIDCVDFSHPRPVGGQESRIYEIYGSGWEELHDQEIRVGFDWKSIPFLTYSIVWN